MSTTTTRLGLTRPDPQEDVDVGQLNANADAIDAAIGAAAVTSGTRPTTGLFDGKLLHESDTDELVVRRSGAWKLLGTAAATADRLARRTTGGRLKVGTATQDDDAATLKQLNDGLAATLSSAAIPAAYPRGRKAGQSFAADGPQAVTTTEIMFDTVTFTAEAGRRYKVTWDGTWIVTGSLVTATFSVRSASGTTVTNAATLAYNRTIRSWAVGEFLGEDIVTEVTGAAAGQLTIGIGIKVALGAGSIGIPGSATNTRKIIVEDIGV